MSRLCRHCLIAVSGTVLDGISPAAIAHYIVAATGEEQPMAVESIFYSVSGMSCRGALIWDEGVKAPRPLLLMAPNWRGVIKPAIETGQMLAGEGYVVFVADMFGRSEERRVGIGC